jgi:ankyrin repeat protein
MNIGRISVKLVILSAVVLTGCHTTQRDWDQAKKDSTSAGYALFLSRHPQGEHVDEAKAAIESLDWKQSVSTNTSPAYALYISHHPQGPNIGEAKAAIERLDWDQAVSANNLPAFAAFLSAHPDSTRITVTNGRVASDVVTHVQMIGYSLQGIATSETVITVDGAQVPVSIHDGCRLGVFECEADIYSSLKFKKKPARSATIYREKSSGRILALDFPDKVTGSLEEAAQDAAVSGDAGEMSVLLKSKPELAYGKNAAGHTLMLVAASWGNAGVVRLLLANHAEVDPKAANGTTALTFALMHGHQEAAQALVDAKADANARDAEGETALMGASLKGFLGVVRSLLAAKADVNAKANDGSTALIDASLQGHLDVVRALIAAKADVNAKQNDSITALDSASSNGYAEIVRTLLDANAYVNDNSGMPLLLASMSGHLDVVQALLAAHADVNAKSPHDVTPLIFASSFGHLDVVQALVAAKADLNTKANGDTALTGARKNRHPEIVQFLKNAGAKD